MYSFLGGNQANRDDSSSVGPERQFRVEASLRQYVKFPQHEGNADLALAAHDLIQAKFSPQQLKHLGSALSSKAGHFVSTTREVISQFINFSKLNLPNLEWLNYSRFMFELAYSTQTPSTELEQERFTMARLTEARAGLNFLNQVKDPEICSLFLQDCCEGGIRSIEKHQGSLAPMVIQAQDMHSDFLQNNRNALLNTAAIADCRHLTLHYLAKMFHVEISAVKPRIDPEIRYTRLDPLEVAYSLLQMATLPPSPSNPRDLVKFFEKCLRASPYLDHPRLIDIVDRNLPKVSATNDSEQLARFIYISQTIDDLISSDDGTNTGVRAVEIRLRGHPFNSHPALEHTLAKVQFTHLINLATTLSGTPDDIICFYNQLKINLRENNTHGQAIVTNQFFKLFKGTTLQDLIKCLQLDLSILDLEWNLSGKKANNF